MITRQSAADAPPPPVTTPANQTPAARTPATGLIVAILALAGIVVSLMQTLVIPIIPHLPEYLNAEASDTAWAVTATLLASAVATPVVGRLGDMYGKRRMLLLSLGVLIAGSIVAGLSSSLIPMIVGRSLQGLAAGVIPLGISIMRDVLPAEKLAGAIAIMSASLGVGGAFGLPLAAVIAEYADWHFLFWISAILAALAAAAIVAVVPESPVRAGGRFDYTGALSLSVTLVALLLAVSKGASWGWSSGQTVASIVIAAVAGAGWVLWERRTPAPLVDVRVSARRQVMLTNVISILFGFAMFAASMVFPQVVQMPEATGYGLGSSMLVAGLVMAPFGLMLLVAAPVSSHITNTYGPARTLMIGALVVAAGYVLGCFMLHSIWQLIVTGLIIGTGTGLAYGAMPALIMGAVPPEQTGAANSFNTLMRALGTSFASAIAGVVLAQVTIAHTAVPSEDAFRLVMALAGGAALISFLIATALPRRRTPIEEAPDSGEPESTAETGTAIAR